MMHRCDQVAGFPRSKVSSRNLARLFAAAAGVKGICAVRRIDHERGASIEPPRSYQNCSYDQRAA